MADGRGQRGPEAISSASFEASRRARITVISALILLSVFAHRGWFRPGMIAFADWRYLVGDTTKELFDLPRAWDSTRDFGRPNQSLQGYPFLLVVGFLGRIGAGFSVAERLIFFFPFTLLPLASMAALCRRFTRSHVAVVVSSSLYSLNTYALMVGNNQLTVAMAYAFAPWIAARALDLGTSTATGRLPRVAADVGALTLVVVASAVYEPRITLLGLVIAGGAFLARCIALRASVPRMAAVVLGLGSILLATQLYWLFTGFGSSGYVTGLLPQNPFRSFATIAHALNLNHPFWRSGPPGVFTREQPLLVLFLLPALVLVALAVLARRDLRVTYFGGAALLGAFLVKGENPPFPRLYGLAFDIVPGMRFYRDMSKFSLWTALGYSIVLGVFSAHTVRVLLPGPPKARILLVTYLAAVGAVVLVPAAPALTQQQGGTFAPADYPTGLRMVHEALQADGSFRRVVWVGLDQPFVYRTSLHPEVRLSSAVDVVGGGVPGGTMQLFSRSGLEDLGRRGVGYLVVGRGLSPWPGATDIERRQARNRAEREAEAHSDLLVDKDGYRLYRLRKSAPLWSVSEACDQPTPLPSRLSRTTPSAAEAHIDRPSGAFAVTYLQRFDTGWTLDVEAASTLSLFHRRTEDGFNCWDIRGGPAREFTARASFGGDRKAALGTGLSLLAVLVVAVGTVAYSRASAGSDEPVHSTPR